MFTSINDFIISDNLLHDYIKDYLIYDFINGFCRLCKRLSYMRLHKRLIQDL